MLLYAGLRGATWWTVLTVVACGAILLSNTIYVGGGADTLEAGARAAERAIDSGAARDAMERFVEKTRELAPS